MARAVKGYQAREWAEKEQAKRARAWWPPAWIVGLILLLTGCGVAAAASKLIGNVHLWMTAERIRGEIVELGRTRRGGYLPVVRATIGEQTFQLRFGDPSITEPPPVGATVTVLVPKSGIEGARVQRAMELFTFPGLFMLVALAFFGAAVALAFERGLLAHARKRLR